MSRRQGHPARHAKPWQPMRKADQVNPVLLDDLRRHGVHDERQTVEAWSNDLYDCIARIDPSGVTHLSIKRLDRSAVHDWRHLQALKNDICGPEREACELYPRESRLMDTANEYHLWVLPAGSDFPFGGGERMVGDLVTEHNEVVRQRTGVPGKGRQRPWQPGITTGLGS